MHTRTVQGSTWFSIFSPRIQNYTIGVEPMDGWGIKKDTPIQPQVSWMGTVRKGRQSLFRRSYDYTQDGAGLERVPIQVWSTKGFQATFQAPLDDRANPVRSELIQANKNLAGGVTSNLPVALQDAVVFHGGKVYRLGTLLPGEKKVLTNLNSNQAGSWFGGATTTPTYNYGSKSGPVAADPEPARTFIRSILFNEAREQSEGKSLAKNGGLRDLDQSWRLRQEDPGEQAVLVGRVNLETGAADDVAGKPAIVARLWLGALPGAGAGPPKISGTMRQETYVRVFLPVKAAGQ
jgi:hypothetical protein